MSYKYLKFPRPNLTKHYIQTMKINNKIKRLLSQSLTFTKPIFLIVIVFLLSSCKEYFLASAVVVLLPEVIFGVFIAIVFVFAVIGLIIHLISGGDK